MARCPLAVAKARTFAGLTTATGSPAASSAAVTAVSSPPVGSTTISCGAWVASVSTNAAIPAASLVTRHGRSSPAVATSNHPLATSIPIQPLIWSIIMPPCRSPTPPFLA